LQKKRIIILGGATAIGKSSLALKWARDVDGEIINADSMQIYRELNMITACPTMDDMAEIPHHLYRYLKGDDPCSAEKWRDMAQNIIDEIWKRGKVPIVVGGTGLYLKALVYGLSKVPIIDESIRKEIRDDVNENGPEQAHAKLAALDVEMANRLAPGDSQRIARALEVIRSTSKSLLYWQSKPAEGGLIDMGADLELNILNRNRQELYRRCDERFKRMIEQGDVINEIRELMSYQYDISLPVMKSLGVPQIIDYIEAKITKEEAITLSQTATRQFAKRQMTWFRNQFSDWNIINL